MTKPILYIDMDGVLVNFQSGIDAFTQRWPLSAAQWEGRWDENPHIFSLMQPNKYALDAHKALCQHYDTYILSTAPWANPAAWQQKVEWVQKHMGMDAHKRLILSHNKHLNRGAYLIDDRTANGADRFEGTLIPFGSPQYPDWEAVMHKMLKHL